MRPMHVLISVPNFQHVFIDNLIRNLFENTVKSTALMYSLQGLGVERFVFTLINMK